MNAPALDPRDLAREKEDFETKGYVVVPGAFRPEEMQVIKEVIEGHEGMTTYAEELRLRCANGERPSFQTLFMWNDTSGDDLFSMATRSYKIFDRLENYFGDEVYDYHNKVSLKYPGVVGLSYHQDYAYWYQMGNLWPDMAACFIAVDPATRENGCIKLIEGSHKLGRIDPVNFESPGDSGIDQERLAAIKEQLPVRYIEQEPGDMVIFHGNVLHGSDDNRSPRSRLALLGTYNTKHNDPYMHKHGHPGYRPQTRVYDEITVAAAGRLPDFELSFFDPTRAERSVASEMSLSRAREILPVLGETLDALSDVRGHVIDASRLPFDKKTIEAAALKIIETLGDAAQTEMMMGVLQRLAEFQDGVGDEPVPVDAISPAGEAWWEIVDRERAAVHARLRSLTLV